MTLTLLSVFLCGGRKKSYDGDGDVSLVQPGIQKSSGAGGLPMLTASSSATRPMNDDFSVGVPPPHIPLADKSDERTLADIESIQSEKAMIREKKSKLAAANSKGGKLPNAQSSAVAAAFTGSASPEGSKVMKGSRSPAH